MNETANRETCHSIKVLDERITRERELREAFAKLMDERDRGYENRFKAQETAIGSALTAQEKLTSASFASSEKAVIKAEDAQREYNARSNEFRGQLDDQAKMLLPRSEAETRFNSMSLTIDEIKKDLVTLREFKSSSGGQREQAHSDRGQSNWVIAMVISLLSIAVGIGISLLVRTK
jgi:hypothetical protein